MGLTRREFLYLGGAGMAQMNYGRSSPRGHEFFAIDGPGQGESLARKIWVDEENYGRAGKAAIDYLVKRPEVDPDRIGIHGISMGSYWGPLIAIHDSR